MRLGCTGGHVRPSASSLSQSALDRTAGELCAVVQRLAQDSVHTTQGQVEASGNLLSSGVLDAQGDQDGSVAVRQAMKRKVYGSELGASLCNDVRTGAEIREIVEFGAGTIRVLPGTVAAHAVNGSVAGRSIDIGLRPLHGREDRQIAQAKPGVVQALAGHVIGSTIASAIAAEDLKRIRFAKGSSYNATLRSLLSFK